MPVKVRPKIENLKLRSGNVVGPGQEVVIPTDEAWTLYIRGLIEIVLDERNKRIELAIKPPLETRDK